MYPRRDSSLRAQKGASLENDSGAAEQRISRCKTLLNSSAIYYVIKTASDKKNLSEAVFFYRIRASIIIQNRHFSAVFGYVVRARNILRAAELLARAFGKYNAR